MAEFEPKIEQKIFKELPEFSLGIVKLEVDEALNLSPKDIALGILKVNNINDYNDLNFIKIDDFRQMLISNKLLDYYKENTGEAVSKISLTGILRFGGHLGYNRISVKEIKENIFEKLKAKSITSINELIIFGLNRFKEIFGEDNFFKYYFKVGKKQSLVNIDFEDYILFGYDINLREIDIIELKKLIRNILNKINYLDDLLSIDVIDFKKIVGDNPILEYYFVYIKKIQKSFILKEDIKKLGIELGLTEKLYNRNMEIQEFLRTNGIKNFRDLKEYKITEIRAMLGSNLVCKAILNELGVDLLEDFRLDHLKRFARRVGLIGVPDDIEYNEEKVKNHLLGIFKSIGVNCLYGLNLYGIKRFERLFKNKRSFFYKYINIFTKAKTGKIISTMHTEDFEKLGIELGFPENLSEMEYKNKLLEFLSKKGKSLDSINKTYVKNNPDIWNNINFRYFMEKVGLKSDIKKLRSDHITDLREYIGNIS